MQIGSTKWLWDYASDEPVKASEMPIDSERGIASEKARAELMRGHHDALNART